MLAHPARAHLAAKLAPSQRVEVALEVVAVEVGAAEDQAVVHLDCVHQLCWTHQNEC